jgi:hypothetical protein
MDGLDSGSTKVAAIVLAPDLTQNGTAIGVAGVGVDAQMNTIDRANYPLPSWNLGNPDIPGDGLQAQCATTRANGESVAGAAGCIFIPVIHGNQ